MQRLRSPPALGTRVSLNRNWSRTCLLRFYRADFALWIGLIKPFWRDIKAGDVKQTAPTFTLSGLVWLNGDSGHLLTADCGYSFIGAHRWGKRHEGEGGGDLRVVDDPIAQDVTVKDTPYATGRGLYAEFAHSP